MYKNLLKIFTISLLSLFIFVGCSSQTNDNTKKAILVTHLSIARDKSFNQGTLEGIEEFVKGTNGKWKMSNAIETKSPEQLTSNLDSAAKSKNDVIITTGDPGLEQTLVSAKKNPESKYIIVDSTVPQDAPENIQGIVFTEHEAAFLAGVAAAMKTKTNKIAFLGGEPVIPVKRFLHGYISGAKFAKKDISIIADYANTFKDASVGKQKAEGFYNSGVDVIFTAASAAGNGVIDAAKEFQNKGKEVWVVGVDKDQYEDGIISNTQKSVILTSAIKKVSVAVENALKDIESGNYKPRSTKVFDIKNNGVGLPEKNINFTPEIENKVKEAQELLKTGQLIVPEEKEKIQDLSNVTGSI